MKFLAVVLAVFLVAQLADVTADDLPFKDLTGVYEGQQNLENTNMKIATEDIPSVTRRCTNVVCNNLCRSRGFRLGVCVSATICRCYR